MRTEPIIGGHGFTVTLPTDWEGRIYQRPTPTAAFTPSNRAAAGSGSGGSGSARTGSGWRGEQTRPVLHLGNFALPLERGDYGSGAVERMGTAQTFIAIVEFGPECLGTTLYGSVGLPRVTPDRFDPNGLQRRIPGQSGFQAFFTEQSRPMCLYVVLGSHRNAAALTKQVNSVLDRIKVTG